VAWRPPRIRTAVNGVFGRRGSFPGGSPYLFIAHSSASLSPLPSPTPFPRIQGGNYGMGLWHGGRLARATHGAEQGAAINGLERGVRTALFIAHSLYLGTPTHPRHSAGIDRDWLHRHNPDLHGYRLGARLGDYNRPCPLARKVMAGSVAVSALFIVYAGGVRCSGGAPRGPKKGGVVRRV
jgi:hypothetical protein